MFYESDTIELKEIFAFKQTGLLDNGEVNGEFLMAEEVPNVYDKIVSRGIDTLKDIFE